MLNTNGKENESSMRINLKYTVKGLFIFNFILLILFFLSSYT
ncbi:hypothetical protein CHRYSEO8AT_530057 [Chryseobacterium sp. 8AT]|nr:hypothetical protein CHRYSEO8AT_530057 [Chryseobacterium sp. 8AT]